MINEILLRRKQKVYLDNPVMLHNDPLYISRHAKYAITIQKNIESLGFSLDKDLFTLLARMEPTDLYNFEPEFVFQLNKLVGADVEYDPMYPNFPAQVMEASDAELFWNAMIHYWSEGRLYPNYIENPRFPLIDDPDLKVVSVGTKKDLMEIFTNLLSSKTNISQQDKEDIQWIIENIYDYAKYLPEVIPLKENAAFLGKLLIENAPIKKVDILYPYFKTATDVLRLVVALSDGDISLAKPTVFRKLKRPERRMIMDLLLNCGNIEEDMFRYQYEWIRIGEVIHPGEFTNRNAKYLPVYKAFENLRENRKSEFFSAKVHRLLDEGDMLNAAKALSARPGEFARLLDKCVRDAENPVEIIVLFGKIADKVSIPVLFQVKYHFIRRKDFDDEYRVIFPKGTTATAVVLESEKPIKNLYCDLIIALCNEAIRIQLAKKESLGNVFVDPKLESYIVPFSQRSASKAVKTFTRGSRIPIGKDAKAIRSFIWWTNTADNGGYYSDSRVDIDLSVAIYDSDWNPAGHVSYTRLRDNDMKAYHSGDITNGGPPDGNGVAEFIDIDIDSIAKKARYAVFQIYSYTRHKFKELPNCRFGWMEREYVNSGEIFEPRTVQMKMDLTADSISAIPVIFDCWNREFIWCDMNLSNNRSYFAFGGNNVESNLRSINWVCYAMTHMSKANMYDLAVLNAQARGTLVNDRDEADIIFSNDTAKPLVVQETEDGQKVVEKDVQVVTAYDIDYWMGKML